MEIDYKIVGAPYSLLFNNGYFNILNRIKYILSGCGFQISDCGLYTYCNSLFYFNVNMDKNSLSQLNDDPESIKGVILAIETDNIIEIYDVCTLQTERKKGIMSRIFDVVINNYQNKEIWLGIDLENTYWDQVLSFYLNKGFEFPVLTKNTGGGFKILPFTVLGLTKKMERSNLSKSELTNLANKLREKYFNSLKNCTTRLFISLEVTNKLKEYLTKDVEYGGKLLNQGFFKGSDSLSYANIVYPLSSEIKGDSNNYIVDLRFESNISFHTHPEICYERHNCFIGWPSGEDFATMIHNFINFNWLKHYVVTKEGIYSLQLDVDFQNILLKIPISDSEIIYNVVLNKYKKLNIYREIENIPEEEYQQTFSHFFRIINSYTLSNLLKDSKIEFIYNPEYDSNLYNISFFSWNDISLNNGIFDCLISNCKEGSCPIPISQI